MPAKILEGKPVADAIQAQVMEEIARSLHRPPCLAVLLVGKHPASLIYISRKIKACASVGIRSLRIELPETTTQNELWQEIERLNADPDVDGILVQLPLPEGIDPLFIMDKISPEKDVDGLNSVNMGKLFMGVEEGMVPCTPLGIMALLKAHSIHPSGMQAVILGRSLIVGRPIAALLLHANATVTILHSKSKNGIEICQQADLIIAALGSPLYLKSNMVKKGAIVIDVGINRIEDSNDTKGYRIVGDADFDDLRKECSAISPVPGGIGPLTIAFLLANTMKCYRKRFS